MNLSITNSAEPSRNKITVGLKFILLYHWEWLRLHNDFIQLCPCYRLNQCPKILPFWLYLHKKSHIRIVCSLTQCKYTGWKYLSNVYKMKTTQIHEDHRKGQVSHRWQEAQVLPSSRDNILQFTIMMKLFKDAFLSS